MGTKVYGIPGCDTVKKARRWFDDNGVVYEFHDYKKLGIDLKTVTTWCEEHGYESVLNKRGTTWRKLDESQKENLNAEKAATLMLENTSLIKRPIVEHGNTRLIGFNETQYAEVFE